MRARPALPGGRRAFPDRRRGRGFRPRAGPRRWARGALRARPRTAMRNFSPRWPCALLRCDSHVAADQRDDLFDLRGAGGFLFAAESAELPRSACGTKSRCSVKAAAASAASSRAGWAAENERRCRRPPRRSSAKCLIEPFDQAGAVRKLALSGTKSKSSGSSLRDLQASGFHARKEFGVGVAEEVDRLHGVADHKAGAPGRARAMRR